MAVLQASGVLAALNAQVAVGPLADQSVVVAALPGNLTGTVQIEGTVDGVTWIGVPSQAYGVEGSSAVTHTVTGGEVFIASIPGLAFARLRVGPFTSGSTTATVRATGGVGRSGL